MPDIIRKEPTLLSHADPFGDLDDLFRGFFVRPFAFEGQPRMQMKMDVKEDEKTYTVHADLPGVKKEDIHVTLDGNRVSISAETRKESEEKEGEKVLRSERYYGTVSRSFTLGQEVEEAGAEAKYSDGVLELVLPKKATAEARKLTIK